MKHALHPIAFSLLLLAASCQDYPADQLADAENIEQTDQKKQQEKQYDILDDKSVVFLWKEVPLDNSVNKIAELQEVISQTKGSGVNSGVTFNAVRHNAPEEKKEAKKSMIQDKVNSRARQPYSKKDEAYKPPTEKGSIDLSGEEYDHIVPNEFNDTENGPVSTLSIDVDNAAYSNARRYLATRRMPPANLVRTEEMINYFDYDYPQPTDEHPFSINTEIGPSPWNAEHQLIHVGLQGKEMDYATRKASNLVFLIDASGSMSQPNKMPLLKESFAMLLDQLSAQDKVSIVAYAGAAGMVLEPTSADQKSTILSALNAVEAGGSTAGGQGIHLAYKLAKANLIEDGNNRVILATDGDFNVGVTNNDELVSIIEEKRKDDIFLTICGFGMGNYKDNRMEQISNAGNGNYFYVDSPDEAEKVFVKEMLANMFTLAKDVKIQVEFNPNLVKAYRLIGYENRLLAQEDFDDDTKDAGELGPGHTVTAIYEVILMDSKSTQEIHSRENKQQTKTNFANNTKDLMSIRFRYKPIKSNTSILIEHNLGKSAIPSLEETSDNFRFSASVAGLGMLLRNSKFKGDANYDMIVDMAKASMGEDLEGYRAEFLRMIKSAKYLAVSGGMEAGR